MFLDSESQVVLFQRALVVVDFLHGYIIIIIIVSTQLHVGTCVCIAVRSRGELINNCDVANGGGMGGGLCSTIIIIMIKLLRALHFM